DGHDPRGGARPAAPAAARPPAARAGAHRLRRPGRVARRVARRARRPPSRPPAQRELASARPRKGAAEEQRVSLVTLGVDDLARSKRFYESLGWRGQEVEGTVFFQAD